eukprot:449444-Prymnesium_polylepis.2
MRPTFISGEDMRVVARPAMGVSWRASAAARKPSILVTVMILHGAQSVARQRRREQGCSSAVSGGPAAPERSVRRLVRCAACVRAPTPGHASAAQGGRPHILGGEMCVGESALPLLTRVSCSSWVPADSFFNVLGLRCGHLRTPPFLLCSPPKTLQRTLPLAMRPEALLLLATTLADGLVLPRYHMLPAAERRAVSSTHRPHIPEAALHQIANRAIKRGLHEDALVCYGTPLAVLSTNRPYARASDCCRTASALAAAC